jgi:hypothetical protein
MVKEPPLSLTLIAYSKGERNLALCMFPGTPLFFLCSPDALQYLCSFNAGNCCAESSKQTPAFRREIQRTVGKVKNRTGLGKNLE